ncbi:alanine racemase, partial [bacterium]|nr:alanine racemase [bacterium]
MIPASKEASWVELSAPALRSNVGIFRSILDASKSSEGDSSKVRLGVVLKANGYGHGLLEVLSVVHPLVDIIHLISPADALEIRKLEKLKGWPKVRILVIGATDPDEFVLLADNDVEVTLGDHNVPAAFTALKSAGMKVVAHVHIETGLSREGFFPKEIESKLACLKEADCPFEVRGALSHFANTEDV